MEHIISPGIEEAKAGKSLTSRSAWYIDWVLGAEELTAQRKPVSKN